MSSGFLNVITDEASTSNPGFLSGKNYVGQLEEYCAQFHVRPSYSNVIRSGLSHIPNLEMSCTLGEITLEKKVGPGSNKKILKQMLAYEVLKELRNQPKKIREIESKKPSVITIEMAQTQKLPTADIGIAAVAAVAEKNALTAQQLTSMEPISSTPHLKVGTCMDLALVTPIIPKSDNPDFKGLGMASNGNYVSRLNELCQQRISSSPLYETLHSDGPSHCPSFTIKCTVHLKHKGIFSAQLTMNSNIKEVKRHLAFLVLMKIQSGKADGASEQAIHVKENGQFQKSLSEQREQIAKLNGVEKMDVDNDVQVEQHQKLEAEGPGNSGPEKMDVERDLDPTLDALTPTIWKETYVKTALPLLKNSGTFKCQDPKCSSLTSHEGHNLHKIFKEERSRRLIKARPILQAGSFAYLEAILSYECKSGSATSDFHWVVKKAPFMVLLHVNIRGKRYTFPGIGPNSKQQAIDDAASKALNFFYEPLTADN